MRFKMISSMSILWRFRIAISGGALSQPKSIIFDQWEWKLKRNILERNLNVLMQETITLWHQEGLIELCYFIYLLLIRLLLNTTKNSEVIRCSRWAWHQEIKFIFSSIQMHMIKMAILSTVSKLFTHVLISKMPPITRYCVNIRLVSPQNPCRTPTQNPL